MVVNVEKFNRRLQFDILISISVKVKAKQDARLPFLLIQ